MTSGDLDSQDSRGQRVELPGIPFALLPLAFRSLAMNLMPIDVSTRKLGGAVGCPKAIFRRSPVTAPQGQQTRAVLLRCQPDACPRANL
jgi:hypothetical protein